MNSASGPYVLVVEDDDAIREIVHELIVEAGVDVVDFPNGAGALEYLAHASPPILLLIDLHMPVMDGWVLCEHLERHATLRSVPRVILSAAGRPGLPPAELPPGTRWISKPIDLDELLGLVRKHVGTDGPRTT